jgi:nitrogen-specific signal transduction histidine kinase/CheY-like chemotaxis protein
VRDDGSKFDVRICAFPLLGINNTVTGFIEIVEDITVKKKLEAQFQKAQKFESIGTLAGGIAHDFNNLLMNIQGNTSLMLMDIDSYHPHYERLKSIEKQIQGGANLTRQLLGYASKGRYEVKPTNLNQIVEETSTTFGRTRKQITIHRNMAEDLFAIEADQGQIEQILLNLFINASDALPGGGDLYIETNNVTDKDMKSRLYKSKAGNYVKLTVRDTGKGMDKITMERIFDPFFTTKEMGRGTGLGLASVYGIIKAHGGYIDVESKMNQGTTFEIYLPSTTKKVDRVTKDSEKLIKQSGTVLLVDDEAAVREICISILEKIGYRVLSAKDGEEVLELYRNNKDEIDIVLLDMIMPNMSGGEIYDRLKEINPEIKVLLSSGYSIDGEATEILNRGCDGFIQKPFDIKKLSAKIGEILDNK